MRLLLAACAAPIMALALSACGSPSDDAAPADTAPDEAAAPMMPTDAPPQEEAPAEVTPATEPEHLGAADRTCRDTIGEAASARLVQRCIAVSPATHPPCNADNACALIQDEIDRACTLFADDPPAECKA